MPVDLEETKPEPTLNCHISHGYKNNKNHVQNHIIRWLQVCQRDAEIVAAPKSSNFYDQAVAKNDWCKREKVYQSLFIWEENAFLNKN